MEKEYYNTSIQDTGSEEGVLQYFRIQDLKKEYMDTAGYRIWRRSTTILQDTGFEEGVHGYCRIKHLEKEYYNTA